jgi:hypothetical protein
LWWIICVVVWTWQVNTTALDAHPSRGLFLSGSLSGHVFLWQYSQDMALSAFTPKARTAASHASSSTGHAAQGAHWGHALSVRFSGCGERFAAVGSGGIIATWRLDQGRPLSSTADLDADSSSLGSADWSHPCFSKVWPLQPLGRGTHTHAHTYTHTQTDTHTHTHMSPHFLSKI